MLRPIHLKCAIVNIQPLKSVRNCVFLFLERFNLFHIVLYKIKETGFRVVGSLKLYS